MNTLDLTQGGFRERLSPKALWRHPGKASFVETGREAEAVGTPKYRQSRLNDGPRASGPHSGVCLAHGLSPRAAQSGVESQPEALRLFAKKLFWESKPLTLSPPGRELRLPPRPEMRPMAAERDSTPPPTVREDGGHGTKAPLLRDVARLRGQASSERSHT